MYTVYMHTDPDGKRYVGATRQTANDRWKNGYGYSDNQCFMDAIAKHGWENIKHEIIATCSTPSEAGEIERRYIALYKTDNGEYGYNHTRGGETNGMVIMAKPITAFKIAYAGFSVRAFAEFIGKSRGNLMQILARKQSATPQTAKKIADALRMRTDELFDFDE